MSTGATPRPSAIAPSTPRTTPAAVRIAASRITSPRSRRASAPRAARIASSRARADTVSAMTDARPTVASTAATIANETNTRIRKRHGALSPSTTLRIVTASPTPAFGSTPRTAARTAATRSPGSPFVRTMRCCGLLRDCDVGT